MSLISQSFSKMLQDIVPINYDAAIDHNANICMAMLTDVWWELTTNSTRLVGGFWSQCTL